jgi:hypothetical protein
LYRIEAGEKVMYTSEKVFIMKFIACLKTMGINEIPYDTEEFNNGAEAMRVCFQRNRANLGKYSNELAMLFLKNPQGGVFSELRRGIQRQNGGLVSFDNPYYVRAEIKLEQEGADYILKQKNIDIANEHLYEFSKAFCDGAGIRIPVNDSK